MVKRSRESEQLGVRELKRQQRRESILDAVEGLVNSGESVTLDAVARVSGVSKVTLYQYFASKQELMQCAAEERGVVDDMSQQPDARTRILQAARKVFSERGLRAATMEEIAQEASVGTVTVYRHFGDKAGLLEAFANTVRPQQALNALELSVEDDLEETLATFAAEALRYLSRNADLVRILFSESAEMPEELMHLRQRPGRTNARLRAFFQELIEAGKIRAEDPKRLALSFLGMMFSFGILAPLIEGEPLTDPDAIGALIASIFVRGVTQIHETTESQEPQDIVSQRRT